MPGMNSLDRLLNVQDLADYLSVPVATIYTWRHHGHGPPGFRVGRHLRFRTSDVAHWIAQRVNHSPNGGLHVTPNT
jgi:excisionase family DNA binding protein